MPALPKPKSPDWRQLVELGMSVTEPRKVQVKRLVNDLVAQGQVARDQATATVEEILELGQNRAEEVRRAIRTEVARQVRALGVATQDDLVALERRLNRKVAAANKRAQPAKKLAAG